MDANNRIKELRQALGLSQAKFAEQIAISNGYIAGLELGNRKLNERISKLICSTFKVNERWLNSGEGDMFLSSQGEDINQISIIFNKLSPAFKSHALSQLQQLLELQRKLEKVADELKLEDE